MLISLDVQGFKSFPEHTEISFHPGVTAIVGPNGSGKSNVTDAIRWGLGEQSARKLRGRKMEDMIFSGTAHRHALGYAEVTLTFDNSNHILPIDFETVAITRRYYRSGESEYLINQSPCRLKDIQELLMDTGVGLEGYSIIGQGKIDDILNQKSEDRRQIFDEASGIMQYKTRKADAERELEKANRNLVRVDDILNELRLQAEPLAKQAADAERYQDLFERFRALDLSLSLHQLNLSAEQGKELEEKRKVARSEIRDTESEIQKIRDRNHDLAAREQALETELNRDRDSYNKMVVAKADIGGEKALAAEREQASIERRRSLELEKSRIRERRSAVADDLVKRTERLEKLKRQHTEFSLKLETATERLHEASEGLTLKERERDDLRQNLQSIQDRIFNLNSFLQATIGEEQSLRNITETEQTTALGEQSERNRLAFRLEEEETNVKQVFDSSHLLSEQLEQANKEKRDAETDVEHLSRRLTDAENHVAKMTYECETLERLEQQYEGYQKPVQRLMQSIEKGQLSDEGVIGPLGTLLFTPDDYAVAIDIALGGAVHHVVCDRESDAKRLVAYLRRERLGRTTFLPLDSLSPRRADQHLVTVAEQCHGFIGIASELVQINEAFQKALDFSLGRVFIAATLDDATVIARETKRRYRVVTLEGDVINPGGSITGGSVSQHQTGLVGRPEKIRRLRQSLDVSKQRIDELQAKKQEALNTLRAKAGAVKDLLEKRQTTMERLSEQKAELEMRKRELDRMDRGLERKFDDLKRNNEKLVLLAQKKKITSDELRSENEKMSVNKQKLDAIENENRSAEARRNQLRDDVTHLTISMTSIDETLRELTEHIEHSEQEKLESDKRMRAIDAENEELEQSIADCRRLFADKSRQLTQLESNLLKTERTIEERKIAQAEIGRERQQLFHELEKKSEQLGLMRGEWSKLEAMDERLASQQSDVLNRIWETYRLTKQQLYETISVPKSVSGATRERSAVRRDLEQIGPINHQAVKDYALLRERLASIEIQREDIEQAKSELKSVVTTLEQSMRERFSATFHQINQNFSQVFSEFFNGGMARLTLEGDEDILDQAIEIRAQPPGKKLQRLSLLSGGERCLTAIALIFAILKLKPTPFVVFDEIESSLDDVNVKRFTDYIARYADSMQFILVTHRKGTMEAADRLYGVAMQERGISRILSTKLST